MLAKQTRNKIIFLAILTVTAVYFAIGGISPLFSGKFGKIFQTGGRELRLGLDLKGGLHLVLQVDLPAAVRHRLEMTVEDLKNVLSRDGLPPVRTEAVENRIRLYFSKNDAMEKTVGKIAKEFPQLQTDTGDSDGNEKYITVSLSEKEVGDLTSRAVEQSLEVIRNRIDQFGVTEPLLVKQGNNRIVVQLPGIDDPARAISLIGKTAQLEFKRVSEEQPERLTQWIEKAVASGRLKDPFNHKELNEILKDRIAPGTEVYIEGTSGSGDGDTLNKAILIEKRTLMTGEYLKSAQVSFDDRFNEPVVGIEFDNRGAKIFERITRENAGRRLAIILDDVLHSAPVIQEPIAGGKARITGTFTVDEAGDLAIVLRAGSLPAPIEIVQNLTVGPSLGQDSIQKGVNAALMGMALVVGFMIIIYRVSGVIANAALVLNLIFMIAALSLFRATLTLPGIAGIVLSIGMAVDTNVLVYERMREEIDSHQTLRAVVEGGYANSLWTIIDSHVTTLITAFALFFFGTGPIKGFAVTLSVGIVLNLFTALYATKTAYEGLIAGKRIKSLRFLEIVRNTGIDFISMRKAAFAVSGILVAVGLFAVVQIGRGHANLGVDLAGGTMVQFRAKQDFQLESIRSAFAQSNLPPCELQKVPREHILIVRVKAAGKVVGPVADQIEAVLGSKFQAWEFKMESKAEVGSSVSSDLKRATVIAMGVSLLGFVGYLAWRFNAVFGIAAAAATFHDVLAVLGLFYLMDKEITLLIVTALLTLAGYSLTDTVVVFDRIRTTMGGKKRKDMGTLINQSINEVLGRTLITSVTVFLVLMALLVFGGPLLRDFAFALAVGVVIGTYSSIFVASPIVYSWSKAGKLKIEN